MRILALHLPPPAFPLLSLSLFGVCVCVLAVSFSLNFLRSDLVYDIQVPS